MELKIVIEKKGKLFEGKAPDIIAEELTSAMYEATGFLEEMVKAGTPRGVFGEQGGLASTIFGEVVEKGTPAVKGLVGHQSKYGEVIEKGRTAGKTWPPEGSLVRWMQVKLGMDEKTAQKMEFVVRRKIGKKGFTGAHMFDNAIVKGWSTLEKIFNERGFNIARRLDE